MPFLHSRLFPKVLTCMCFADNVDAIRFCLIHAHKEGTVVNVSDDIPDGGKDVDLDQLSSDVEKIMNNSGKVTIDHALPVNWYYTSDKKLPVSVSKGSIIGLAVAPVRLGDYAMRQQAVEEVAKANPNNIQEVAASQLSIINSYYQSGLHQSQQSFKWSLIWGGIGLAFLIAAVSFLLIREPTEVAVASGIAGIIEEMVAGFFLYLYKHASDQLAAFRASLESTQRLLLANSMCEKLEGEVEQTTRAELIRLMVNSAVQLTTVSKGKKE